MTVPAQKRIAPASFFPMPMLIRSGQKDTILSETVFSGRLFFRVNRIGKGLPKSSIAIRPVTLKPIRSQRVKAPELCSLHSHSKGYQQKAHCVLANPPS